MVILVIDGISAEYAVKNPAWNALMDDARIKADGFVRKSQVELPSMSVPNWIALVTGAPPEHTGVWGNLFVPATPFDTLFDAAYRSRLTRTVTGSDWWGDILDDGLDPLVGRSTIAFAGEQDVRGADDKRTAVMRRSVGGDTAGMSATPSGVRPVDLTLCHWSSVDTMGHLYGDSTEYQEVMTARVNDIAALLDDGLLDEDTLLIVTGDHGHVERGGHGGTAPQTLESLTLFYASGSGIGGASETTDLKMADTAQLVDVPATAAAWLGIDQPSDGLGVPVRPVLAPLNASHVDDAYMRLWSQKHRLFRHILVNTWGLDEAALVADEPALGENRRVPASEGAMIDEVEAMRAEFDAQRSTRISRKVLKHIAIGLPVVGIIFVALALSARRMPIISLRENAGPAELLRLNVIAAAGAALFVVGVALFSWLVYGTLRSACASAPADTAPLRFATAINALSPGNSCL